MAGAVAEKRSAFAILEEVNVIRATSGMSVDALAARRLILELAALVPDPHAHVKLRVLAFLEVLRVTGGEFDPIDLRATIETVERCLP